MDKAKSGDLFSRDVDQIPKFEEVSIVDSKSHFTTISEKMNHDGLCMLEEPIYDEVAHLHDLGNTGDGPHRGPKTWKRKVLTYHTNNV